MRELGTKSAGSQGDRRHEPASPAVGSPAAPLRGDQAELAKLQRAIGNRATTELLAGGGRPRPAPRAAMKVPPLRTVVTRTPAVQRLAYKSVKGTGQVELKENANPITAAGTLVGKNNDGIYDPAGTDTVKLDGSLDYKDSGESYIIGVIKATPKRTAIGEMMVWALAEKAVSAKKKYIATELSALEEGTPEFYAKIGLEPDPEWAASMLPLVNAEAERGDFAKEDSEGEVDLDKKFKRLMQLSYSGALKGDVKTVKERTERGFKKYWA